MAVVHALVSLVIRFTKSCCERALLAVVMAPLSVMKTYEGVRVMPNRLDMLVLVSMSWVNSIGRTRVNARRSAGSALVPTPMKLMSGCRAAAVVTIAACCLHAAQDGAQNHSTVGLPHRSWPENPAPSSDRATNCSCQGTRGSDVSVDAWGLAAGACCDVNSLWAGEHPAKKTAVAINGITLFFKLFQPF